MTVYFISGLGADERLFENLILPSSIIIKHIHWIEPLKKERLSEYCQRLSQQVDTTDDFIFIGLSFGGIVAIELNKSLHSKQIILISSVATKYELPSLFKFINLIKLHKIIPSFFLKWYNPFINWAFGAKTKREKGLIASFLKNVTKNYLKWSINEVLNWDNKQKPTNLLHVHGTADRILPYHKTHTNIEIKNGGHLMVHNKADEISKILSEKINSSC